MKTNIKNTLCLTAVLAASSFLFMRCDSGDEFENSQKNEIKVDLSGEITQLCANTLVIDENNPSNMYARVDSAVQYSYGMAYSLPDSLKDCTLKIVLSGKMRETESPTGYLAIALHGRDTMLFWGNIYSKVHVPQLNAWTPFKDSVLIEKTANKPSAHVLKVFAIKQTGKGYYDVDDLQVKISRN